MKISPAKKRFQTINLVTVFLVFAVILAGGIVRSTGSGMGCPDWPKCFDCIVPPTNVNQIPKDYKARYVAQRSKKNERFAHTLDVFGFKDLAQRIRNDKSILVPEEFNAAKTWTEYVNRLIGEVTGIFMVLTVVFSFAYKGTRKRIVVASVVNLLLIVFQAWFGSIVVSTNLVSWTVTVHMLLALAILAIAIYTYHEAVINNNSEAVQTKPFVKLMAYIAIAISIIQITLGTEVREAVDMAVSRFPGQSRGGWVADAGSVFVNHRELSILVLVINVLLYALIRKGFSRHSVQQQLMSFTFLMIMLQIVSGIALSYWGLPPVAQAIHIILASLVFGAQVYLAFNLQKTVKVWGVTA